MADISPGELQTLVAVLSNITQQLGNIAQAITTGTTTRAGTPSAANLSAPAPAGPIAGYMSIQINGRTITIPYYTG